MMKFVTDHCFHKGYTHEVCEDYAFSDVVNGIPMAVVCDGCSSSTGEVDVGARILAHAFKNAVANLPMFHNNIQQEIIGYILQDIREVKSVIRLSNETFDCTMNGIFIYENKVHHIMFGDGYLGVHGDYGVSVEYTENAPLYISYLMDNDRLDQYIDRFNQYVQITVGDSDESKFIDVNDYLLNKMYYTAYDLNDLFRTYHDKRISITVMSDGVASFISKDS